MILGIVGTRRFDDYDKFKEIVDNYLEFQGIRPELIVSGGAPGIDSLAEQYAQNKDIPIKIYPADWDKYGRRAGPIRNTQIVDACTHLLALPDSKSIGTLDTIKKAELKGIRVMKLYLE